MFDILNSVKASFISLPTHLDLLSMYRPVALSQYVDGLKMAYDVTTTIEPIVVATVTTSVADADGPQRRQRLMLLLRHLSITTVCASRSDHCSASTSTTITNYIAIVTHNNIVICVMYDSMWLLLMGVSIAYVVNCGNDVIGGICVSLLLQVSLEVPLHVRPHSEGSLALRT